MSIEDSERSNDEFNSRLAVIENKKNKKNGYETKSDLVAKASIEVNGSGSKINLKREMKGKDSKGSNGDENAQVEEIISDEVMVAYRISVESLKTRGVTHYPPGPDKLPMPDDEEWMTPQKINRVAMTASVITSEYALEEVLVAKEEMPYRSNMDQSYEEGNQNLLYMEVGILPWEDKPYRCSGRVIANIDNGAALSLIDQEVYEALKLSDSLNIKAKTILAVGLLDSKPQEMVNRVDFYASLRTDQGYLVRILVRARVTTDLGIPLLIGAPCMMVNDMEIHLRAMQVSVGVDGQRVMCNAICRCSGIRNSSDNRHLRMSQDQEIRAAGIQHALGISRPGASQGTGNVSSRGRKRQAKIQRVQMTPFSGCTQSPVYGPISTMGYEYASEANEEILQQCAVRGIITTEAIKTTLRQWAEEEANDLQEYAAMCSDRYPEARPEMFPKEYWSKVRDECKQKVTSIWSRYPSERLSEIIPEVMSMDISQEDNQRRLEEPYVRAQLLANINVYFDVDKDDAPKMKRHVYTFEMIDGDKGQPIKLQSQRFNANERAFLQAKMSIMVKQGRVVRRAGPNNNPLMLVPYPERIKATFDRWEVMGLDSRIAMVSSEFEADVSTWYRLTIDLRALNKRTKPMRYPIPRIDDCLANKESGRWTAGDVMDAFYTLEADESATRWQGFTTHEGHYEMKVMAQGAMNAAMFWASVISVTFEPICQGEQTEIIVYQDDVFNTINNFLKHMRMNETVGSCLTDSGLRIKCTKYHGNYRQMKVLGHVMTRMGKYSDPELVRAITDIGVPTTQGEVRSILGLAIVAREYVHELSEILAPLQDLIKKGVHVIPSWKDEVHGAALRKIKRILTSRPVLLNIRFDKQFRIHVDACRKGRGIGAVLLQQNEHNDNQWQPVAYWSFKLTSAEREYSATDLECKGMHDAILHWSCYLTNGLEFDVVTDHYALVYLVSKPAKDSNGRIMRYIMDIQGYRFGIIHRRGQLHIDADTVSRLLRYDDSMLRILTKEQLQEEGVVTVKDQEDLLWNGGVVLPYPGINRKTKEQLLDDIESNRNQWGDEEKKLITIITLRHELEKLVNMQDDPVGFVDQMEEQFVLNEPEESDEVVSAGSMVECKEYVFMTRRVQFSRPHHYMYRHEEIPSQLRKSVEETELLNDEPAWKRYDPLGSGSESESMEQKKLNFEARRAAKVLSNREDKLGDMVEKDIMEQCQDYEEKNNEIIAEESLNTELEEEDELILELLTCSNTRINEREHSTVTRAAVHRVCDVLSVKLEMIVRDPNIDINRVAEVGGIQTRSRTQANTGLHVSQEEILKANNGIPDPWIEEERHYDELMEITDEEETTVFNNQYLSGRKYIDDDDGRLYEVLDVFWSKEYNELLAYRIVRDGAPPSEHDDAPFKVLDGASNIKALVEKYEQTVPFEERMMMTEENIRSEQLTSSDMKKIWGELEKVEYIGGIKRVKVRKRTYIDRPGLAIREARVINTNNSLMTIIRKVEPIMLPRIWRNQVMSQYHMETGHVGAARMKNTMIRVYVWLGMGVDIVEHCRSCMHCQRRNISTTIVQEPPLMVYPRLSRPFERSHMDLFGPLPLTKSGFKYVLVFKCALTKWVEQFALRSKSAEDVAECFVDEIVLRHGAPRVLVSDAGKEFINYNLKAICKLLNIRKVTTSPYNPRADGLAENQVKTTKDMLSSYCNAHQDDWDKYLSVVSHYYRTTYNDAIGMTPFYAMYGRECDEIKTAWIAEVREENKEMPAYVEGLSLSLIEIWESLGLTVFENGMSMQRQQRKRVKKALYKYKVGDLVMVKKVPNQFYVSEDKVDDKASKAKIRRAFQDRYRGPFKVTKVVSDITLRIQMGANGDSKSVAYKNIKPYVESAVGQDNEDEEDVLGGMDGLWDEDAL